MFDETTDMTEKAGQLQNLLAAAVKEDTSDIFLIPGMPISFKVHGNIRPVDDNKIFPEEMDLYIKAIYSMAGGRSMKRVTEEGDDDFSFSLKGLSRFRASVMKQRGSLAAVIRVVRFDLPSPETLHIPESIMELSNLSKGLVLVTGPAGSGKSTTLACIIDRINRTRNVHVITLEDPIEFLHRHQNSVVTQREIGLDTDSYVNGLRAAIWSSPRCTPPAQPTPSTASSTFSRWEPSSRSGFSSPWFSRPSSPSSLSPPRTTC